MKLLFPAAYYALLSLIFIAFFFGWLSLIQPDFIVPKRMIGIYPVPQHSPDFSRPFFGNYNAIIVNKGELWAYQYDTISLDPTPSMIQKIISQAEPACFSIVEFGRILEKSLKENQHTSLMFAFSEHSTFGDIVRMHDMLDILGMGRFGMRELLPEEQERLGFR